MRHLLTGFEFSQDEYLDILETASAMKKDPAKFRQELAGRSGAIMFEKPSLRTRTTFELAFYRLGGHGVYLDLQNGELGKRETIADYSRNLCRWVDCLVGRVFSQRTLEELAQYGSVPVIKALSDLYHPAQAMADYMTIQEHLGKIKGVKVAYVGDVWQTVTFYIHTGETAKNYRLEVWSGDRNGAANPADSYVIFDMNYTGDAESNFATLIEENKDNANATSFENVFSYFDSDKYLRYNVELDANKVGNVYEKSYDATEQTAGVAYLTYTEENETRIFADYSYQDKTVAATIEDDNSSKPSSPSKDKEENDTNVWLLISSIAVAAVLVLAIASIALQKVLKKAKKNVTKKAPVKAKKEKATKKAAKSTKQETVDEDSPYND